MEISNLEDVGYDICFEIIYRYGYVFQVDQSVKWGGRREEIHNRLGGPVHVCPGNLVDGIKNQDLLRR